MEWGHIWREDWGHATHGLLVKAAMVGPTPVMPHGSSHSCLTRLHSGTKNTKDRGTRLGCRVVHSQHEQHNIHGELGEGCYVGVMHACEVLCKAQNHLLQTTCKIIINPDNAR